MRIDPGRFTGPPPRTVLFFDVRRSEEDRKVSVNRTQGFAPVPEDVRNFHIGGYRALDKCLKSRKGRKHFSPQDRDAGLSDPVSVASATRFPSPSGGWR